MNGKEFLQALENITKEKGIDKSIVLEAMEAALNAAYKKNFNSLTNSRVTIDEQTGEIKVFSYKTVVEEIENEKTEIDLEEAQKIIPNIQIGETIENEVTPKDFGRVAASTAKQVVVQKIKEAEKNSLMEEFEDKKDELMMGILSREDEHNYFVDLGRTHGILPKNETITGEKLEMGSQVRVYISKVDFGPKGPFILLSRTHYGFLKRLLENEIPELEDGTIMLYSVARDAGIRSKISVYTTNPNVDPIGAIIGEKGNRIARILKELNGEKIDVVLYDKDPITFIKNALSPAKNLEVIIEDPKKKEASVIVDDDNLSLAIGKKGQNVKLAARLTHYKLEILKKSELNTKKENDKVSDTDEN
ncbi:MAG: transcription termination factor NusA [Bacilli bacterium]